MIKNFLVALKKTDNHLSDQSDRRKELLYMKKTGPPRVHFILLVQNVWAVGIDIMTGVLSAQTHTVFKKYHGGIFNCQ